MDNLELWDQQDGESAKAFHAFTIYRDLGHKRSIRAVAERLKSNDAHLGEWSRKFDWTKRAIAWDTFLDAQSQQAQVDQVRAMKIRQIELGMQAQGLASLGLQALIDRLKSDLTNPDLKNKTSLIKAEGLAKLMDLGCRIERLNRDESEQNIEIKSNQDFSKLNFEELQALKNLIDKSQQEGL